MRRRFDVLNRLATIEPGHAVGEVGCGNGVVQQQLEEHHGIAVDGIDLNEYALRQNQTERGRLLCYNVFDRNESLRETYDSVILFDVIEHLDDDAGFLDAVLHLVKPGGRVFINVPAFMHLFSHYDVAQGHFRRYDWEMLRTLAASRELIEDRWTYWGMPLIPLLYLRKLMLSVRRRPDVIEQGFAVHSKTLNSMLTHWSRAEWIPQHVYGTSLMASFIKPTG